MIEEWDYGTLKSTDGSYGFYNIYCDIPYNEEENPEYTEEEQEAEAALRGFHFRIENTSVSRIIIEIYTY